ncbi:carbohydrate ABC transporter permease [Dolosicoccus paucivorans]|uniref:Carbohydrate ABC transporter permease n=1 Tax=Dolosicoccus paucivorans TaxID=84521 RepID=A0A1G8KU32_9LACT|nr:carbohydrate ABC transporter permease [Dolosicoccus paucivorans]PMB83965.1 carbohydrate ABC transporter permease [Dolosicoccus paucivorans]PMC58245.1 carbohydrate ABC transporter permease [Dolosicoccus paucivorans]SDI46857.1 multiple sugar transport system permease protein [Dolosicoccus paucivorans]
MSKRAQNILLYTLLTLGSFLMILPFYWMIATSLKTGGEAVAVPPTWIPKRFLFSNYQKALEAAPFGRYFLNSVIVTVTTTIGEVFTSILAAYAFSKLHFWGKNALFLFLLATMMVPGELMTIPNFVTLSNFKMINTYWALIIPWLASVFSVFTLKQSFESVPDELYYAAKVDGASDWKYLWGVLVPLSKSSIIAVMILKVIGSWNSFMWPLIVTNDKALRTLPVGLQAFTTEAGTHYELLMAASTIVVLPMVIIYLLLQKYIIQGISRSGLKG